VARAGRCVICGRSAELTFEHLPPRSTGNFTRRRGVDMITALNLPLGEIPSSGWTSMQKGVGTYSTCRGCNSFDGRAYVPAYREFVYSLTRGLVELSESVDREEEPKEISLKIVGLRPGAIVRQAIYMLLAANENSSLGDRYPRLREIVLSGARLPLDGDMRLRMAVVVGSRIRLMPLQVQWDLATGRSCAVIELAAPPLAWLLEIGPSLGSKVIDVSHWTMISSTEVQAVSVTTVLGSNINAVPGDYRYPSEILAASGELTK
jgi:hypothetical protein